MQFLNCPVCGRPMVEEPEKSEFHFYCADCNRHYLYEEGTLIDLGAPDAGGETSPPAPPHPRIPGKS